MSIPVSFVISRHGYRLLTIGDRYAFLFWRAVTIRGIRFALGLWR